MVNFNFVASIVGFMLFLTALAHAEAPYSPSLHIAVLQCDATHNHILVRFGLSRTAVDTRGLLSTTRNQVIKDGEYTPISKTLENQFKSIPYLSNANCTLRNGQNISLVTEDAGLNSGDTSDLADARFEFKVDDHIVYDDFRFHTEDVYPMSVVEGDADYAIISIEYNGKTLSECTQILSDGADCKDASERLSPSYIFANSDELLEWNKQQAQRKLAAGLSFFCKSIDFSINYPNPSTYHVIGGPSGPLTDPTVGGDRYNGFSFINEFHADINNSGKSFPVFAIGIAADDNPVTDFLIAFTKRPEQAKNFSADVRSGTQYNSENQLILTPSQKSASIQIGRQMAISEFDTPNADDLAHTYMVFQLKDVTYIYVTSAGNFVEPDSMILQILPDDSIKTICAYP